MTQALPNFVAETEFAVRYAETDAMGVVHHASFLVYFEEGRSHYLRQLGSDYALLERQGYRLPVTEAGLRCVKALRYGERVWIRAWIEENRSRRLSFYYELGNNLSDEILTTGFTRHVWTDHLGKVISRPPVFTELMNNIDPTDHEPAGSARG